MEEKCTCLQDHGVTLCNRSILTQSNLVFSEHSELVGIAHDKVRDGGIQSVVMLHHSVPVLKHTRRWDDELSAKYYRLRISSQLSVVQSY